jgi:hypothetical protein
MGFNSVLANLAFAVFRVNDFGGVWQLLYSCHTGHCVEGEVMIEQTKEYNGSQQGAAMWL